MRSTGLIGVADDPVLDFLNSTAKPAPETVELINDGQSYLEWLECAGLLDKADQATIRKLFSVAELDVAAAQAVAFREWLRPVIATWAAPEAVARPIPTAVRSRLDDVLRHDRGYFRMPTDGESIDLARGRHWHDPQQLLVPAAEAAARLLTTGDRSLVRHCEGTNCTLWFYDRTKSHRRRWCSMAVCGNRAKARTLRQRKLAHHDDRSI
jgi:predicted RNA-binding Zn ribbon-like protein